MIAFWPNIGKRKQTAVVGHFGNKKTRAEPRGTCHGALVPLFRPAAGACLPQAGRRAQRQINIVKLTHYPDDGSV